MSNKFNEQSLKKQIRDQQAAAEEQARLAESAGQRAIELSARKLELSKFNAEMKKATARDLLRIFVTYVTSVIYPQWAHWGECKRREMFLVFAGTNEQFAGACISPGVIAAAISGHIKPSASDADDFLKAKRALAGDKQRLLKHKLVAETKPNEGLLIYRDTSKEAETVLAMDRKFSQKMYNLAKRQSALQVVIVERGYPDSASENSRELFEASVAENRKVTKGLEASHLVTPALAAGGGGSRRE